MSHLEFDWQSPVWRPWLEALCSRHTLVRYDERGCGLSDWDVAEFTLDAWVHDLETVVDAAGLERFALLGMSQGGPVAVVYAARHPERVEKLVLYGSYARGRRWRGLSPAQQAETETFLELIRLGWGKENPAFRQVFTTEFMPDGSREQYDWFDQLMRKSTSAENAVRLVRGFQEIDVTELVSQVAVPALVLHARGDARAPIEEGRLLAALLPDARFVELDSRNHILLEGEPAFDHFMVETHRFLGVAPPEGSTVAPPGLPADLTARELQVLELLAEGLGNKAIAKRLYLSPKTVRNYVSILLGKLGVDSRVEAVVAARRAGFGGGF